jgi:hypothetical protein
VNNKWVLATIVGQAVVTLVAIGYGVSAHSSWETERQRRLDSERAAVAEMATAMKAAGERLDKVEQELRRCRIRARRRAQSPAAAMPTPPVRLETPVAPTSEQTFSPTAPGPAPTAQAHARP